MLQIVDFWTIISKRTKQNFTTSKIVPHENFTSMILLLKKILADNKHHTTCVLWCLLVTDAERSYGTKQNQTKPCQQ